MDNLKTTTDLVKDILKNNPSARNSDNVLYYCVLSKIGKRNGIDIENMSITTFFLHLKEYGFPQFESVRRTRQKIQACHPELSGCDTVEAHRTANEEVFRDYARQVNV